MTLTHTAGHSFLCDLTCSLLQQFLHFVFLYGDISITHRPTLGRGRATHTLSQHRQALRSVFDRCMYPTSQVGVQLLMPLCMAGAPISRPPQIDTHCKLPQSASTHRSFISKQLLQCILCVSRCGAPVGGTQGEVPGTTSTNLHSATGSSTTCSGHCLHVMKQLLARHSAAAGRYRHM